MPDPLEFPATTPRHSLPLLFAGQAQKEFFVNAALSLCDALLHPAIDGEAASPPAAPAEAECWLVMGGASGEFAGREGHLACRQAGAWLFAAPRDGMRVFDRSTGQVLVHIGEWRRGAAVQAPVGGATIDQEARAAIAAVIAALSRLGVFPAN
jgi:hypothetical protein